MMLYISARGLRIVMDRRIARIALITFLTALAVGVLPVIPVGEVLAPENSLTGPQGQSGTLLSSESPAAISPVADATTIEKLRHLFSH